MSQKTRGKAPKRKRPVARDLTAMKTTGLTGGIVTDNKDPDRLYRTTATDTAFFRSATGLRSETE